MVGAWCVKRRLKLIGFIALAVWINTYKAKKKKNNDLYINSAFHYTFKGEKNSKGLKNIY